MSDDKFLTFMLGLMPAFFFLSILFLGQRKNLSSQNLAGVALLFFCSILTIKLALFLNMAVFSDTSLQFDVGNLKTLFLAAFLGVGMNEEGAKLIPILTLLYLSPKWRTTQDIYFACICVGACFAGIENVFVEEYSTYNTNLMLRNLLAVPAHLSFACLMAPFLAHAVKRKDFSLSKNKVYAFIFLLVEIFLAFGVFYWLASHSFFTPTKMAIIKYSYLAVVLMFLIHIVIKINQKHEGWYSVFYDTGFIMLAVLVPSILHGWHDFIVQIFSGYHSLICHIALIFTYFSIILHTYFYMSSIPTVEKVLFTEKEYFEPVGESASS